MSDFFKGIEPVPFKGPDSDDPMAFRFYEPDRMVMGKRMEDQLRMAVAYWHSFAWPGGDPFGGRPSSGRGSAAAWPRRELKAEVAFEMFTILGREVLHLPRPRHRAGGQEPRRIEPQRPRDRRLLRAPHGGDRGRAALGHRQPLLQPPLHGRRRHQPRPGRLRLRRGAGEGGDGRHPRPQGRQLRALGRPRGLRDAAQHRHEGRSSTTWAGSCPWWSTTRTRSASRATILIEPKPQEPTKHQYDYDVATVFGFLQRFGLEKEVKLNIEVGHAYLAGHSFEHELATAMALGVFGSIDSNRNDLQSGWDTDQFPNNVPGDRARDLLHPAGPAASPPAASTSTPSSAASRSIPRTSSPPMSAPWTSAPAASSPRRR